MMYIPTNLTLEESWQLSADLWRQVAPNAAGETRYLVAPLTHLETGLVYFRMSLEDATKFNLDTNNAINDWPEPDSIE